MFIVGVSAVPSPGMKVLSEKLSYDPTKLIARGAFSNVYQGLLRGELRVAVKRIPKSETDNSRVVMNNEAKMLERLGHPYIVRYFWMENNDDFW